MLIYSYIIDGKSIRKEYAMNIKYIIHSAGQNLHTVIITAKEKDGSTETREAKSLKS